MLTLQKHASPNSSNARTDDNPAGSQKGFMSVSHVGSVAVVALTSPCIMERQATQVLTFLSTIARQNSGKVVLDVSNVGRFSCAWINALLGLTNECRGFGGNLVLVGLKGEDVKLFRHTGLLERFTRASDRVEGCALLGERIVSPWRLAVARLLDLPVAQPGEPARKAA